MIAAGGVHQQRLAEGGPAVFAALEQQAAQGFGAFRAARFAGGQHLAAERSQTFGEPAGLGGFARPLPAFQGDESSARHEAHIGAFAPSRKRAPGVWPARIEAQ